MGLKARPNSEDRQRSYEFSKMSVTEISRLVRHGVVSPVEVLEWFIQQAEATNPSLNAIVAQRYEAAVEDARRLETRIQRGWDAGPLAGIPFTTKEMVSVEGMPITAGSLMREGAKARQDADVVARLREADAIIIGVTNQSELGLWYESTNPVYGRTNNPYHLEHTAGGSSGGEGAAVGSGFTGFGIGSDMGGSIRIPAFYCGTFGHKPTGRSVPTAGHFPVDFSNQRMKEPPSTRYISIGPITRDAEDLRPIFDIVSGRGISEEPHRIEPEKLTVHMIEDPGMKLASAPDPRVVEAVREATRVLESAGAQTREYDGPSLRKSMAIYTHALAEENGDFDLRTMLGGGRKPSLLKELPASFLGRGSHSRPALLLIASERFLSPRRSKIEKYSRIRHQLQEAFDAYLGRHGVLVMPTLPNPAPRHGGTLRRPFDLAYTALWNALEVPVTAVPMGFTDAGIPVGIQIVGARGHDDLTIGVAELLQSGGASWKPPY